MIFENKNEYEQTIMIECGCGCSAIKIVQWLDDGIVFIGHEENNFYSRQQPIRTAIKRYLKRLWCAIKGKEYQFFDIGITDKKTIIELKSAINLLDENLLK